MGDVRKSFVFAVMSIIIGAGAARAQNPGTCSATSGNDPLVRSEGQTELTGAISLVCNTVPSGMATLEITLNNGTVPLTSRPNEAMLQVDNDGTVTTIYGTIVTQSGSSLPNNDMRFVDVPITAASPYLTISGIRANINPAYVPLNSAGYSQVTAGISVTSGVLPILLVSGGLYVATVYPGLGPVTVSGPQVSGCGGAVTLGTGVNFTVNIPEVFPTVFLIQGPNGNYDSETGTVPGALQADSGTQLGVSLGGLPFGIDFYLPLNITSNGPGTAVLVTGPGSTTAISDGLVTLDGIVYEPVNGVSTYYYNVLSTNVGQTDAFSIPLYNSAATFTSGFTANVTVNLGPLASIAPATVPRFMGGAPTVGLGFTPTATVSTTSLFADSTGGSPQALAIVTPASACTWSASEYGSSGDSTWIQLAPASGVGNGTMTVALSPNTTGMDRTGTIQVNNASIAVSQAFTAEVFGDVPPSAYYFDAVNLLSTKGITNGCSTTDFCPTDNVTRAQMAVFIVRTIFGGDDFTYSPTPYFTDVPSGSFGFAWIQKMYELGITTGCGPSLFCPTDDVTRAQMAIFIIRMRYGATTVFDYPSTPYFVDVTPTSFGWGWIQRLREDNITTGCGPTTYCPENPVTRGDMAIFVMRGGFNQLLPAGEPILLSISPTTIVHGADPVVFTLTGLNTNFASGLTTIGLVQGLTVGTITVVNSTMLTVQLSASSDAALDPVSPLAITGTPPGNEEAVLPNGLIVQ